MNVILVIGLPASGRYHYCLERNKTFNGVIVNETIINNEGYKSVTDPIENDNDFIYADVAFCDPKVLNSFLEVLAYKPYINIEYVYFENEPYKCFQNTKNPNRKPKYIDKFILGATEMYKVPKHITPLKVYDWKDVA